MSRSSPRKSFGGAIYIENICLIPFKGDRRQFALQQLKRRQRTGGQSIRILYEGNDRGKGRLGRVAIQYV